MPDLKFDPNTQIPSLEGKVILITGGTAGLGYQSAVSLAAHNATHIYFTGRSQASANKLIDEVKGKHPQTPITFIPCDLTSLVSVRRAAKDLLDRTNRLNIAIANAGVMAIPPGQTKEGYEIQFGTNHMGHALLIKLLTPILEKTAEETGHARIVWLTSLGYQGHPSGGILFDKLKTPQADIFPVMGQWMRYSQAKLANLLYARAFAKHHPSITSVSVHPGVAATGLVTDLGFMSRMLVYVTNVRSMLPPEQCARNQQWAATAKLGKGTREVESGVYYEPVGLKGKLAREAGNDQLAEKLWEWTQRELESYEL